MSIFITNLAFVEDPSLVTASKLSILLASLTAGVVGYAWLSAIGRGPVPADEVPGEGSL
jgi:NhaA family Na+:H+ antiporter